MSTSAFNVALAFTLKEEGGYVNNPHDSGGATNHGITQAVYDSWRDNLKKPRRSVQKVSKAEVRRIYGMMYWMPGHCGEMKPALAVCHFDWCVNHGVAGAIRTLQQVLGLTADGDYGPRTAAAVAAAGENAWKAYEDTRRSWYRARVEAHPDQALFLKGWLGRVDRLDAYVEGLR